MNQYAYRVIREFRSTAEKELNRLGEQGWRVIAVSFTGEHEVAYVLERQSSPGLR